MPGPLEVEMGAIVPEAIRCAPITGGIPSAHCEATYSSHNDTVSRAEAGEVLMQCSDQLDQ